MMAFVPVVDYSMSGGPGPVRSSMAPGFIDQDLETCNLSFDTQSRQCYGNPPQMQRYLRESNKMLFTAPDIHPGQAFSFPAGIPVHRRSSNALRRSTTPFSPQYSSACSNMQSPPPDSDVYHDGTQGPPTPPDPALASPSMDQKLAHDTWDGHNVHLLGLPYAPSNGCINPSDINPIQPAQLENDDVSGMLDFKHTYGSDGSIYQPAVESPETFAAEPTPPLKQEMIAPSSDGRYYHDHETRSDLRPDQTTRVLTLASTRAGNGNQKPKKARKPSRSSNTRPGRVTRRPATASVTRQHSSSKEESGDYSKQNIKAAKNMKQCDECQTSFTDESSLRKHKRADHTRSFTCVFQYAGCSETFATKNEWKRHVVYQHLALQYWLCNEDGCAQPEAPASRRRSASLPTVGAIFNRKDLFTQHVRRMHAPPHIQKAIKNKKPIPEWDNELHRLQEAAIRHRCDLPKYMRCPAAACEKEFKGVNAWDDRMEHVARHLERAAMGEEPPVRFGGAEDPTLAQWAEHPSVGVTRCTADGWELCNPLKDVHISRSRVPQDVVYEEDAEGEDC